MQKNFLLVLMMLLPGKDLQMILKTTQQGLEDSHHQKRVSVTRYLFYYEGSGNERGVVASMDDSDDIGEKEKALYGKAEENDEEDEEQEFNEDNEAKDEKEEEQEDSKVGEETDENKEHMSSDIDDTDEESDAGVPTNVHPKAKKQSSDSCHSLPRPLCPRPHPSFRPCDCPLHCTLTNVMAQLMWLSG